MTNKFFNTPFASESTNREDIPVESQTSGYVSFEDGYTFDYERDPSNDSLAKYIERKKNNALFYDITTALKDLQIYGVSPYITSAMNDGVAYDYPIGGQCYYDDGTDGLCVYYNTVDNNSNVPSISGTVQTGWVKILDVNGLLASSDNVSYDNSTSGLTSTNVKDAIDEIVLGDDGGSPSFINGLIPTWVDATTVQISGGGTGLNQDVCRADDGTLLTLSANTNAVLSGASADTTYHLFIGLDGTSTVLEWDSNEDGSGLSNIDGAKRMILPVKTDVSGNIRAFKQTGLGNKRRVDYTTYSRDYYTTTNGGSFNVAVSAPNNTTSLHIFLWKSEANNTVIFYARFDGVSNTVSTTNYDMAGQRLSGLSYGVFSSPFKVNLTDGNIYASLSREDFNLRSLLTTGYEYEV